MGVYPYHVRYTVKLGGYANLFAQEELYEIGYSFIP